MEGHFLVCENAEEEFDISFQVNSTMDSVIPKDQQELYVKAESACNIIKAFPQHSSACSGRWRSSR